MDQIYNKLIEFYINNNILLNELFIKSYTKYLISQKNLKKYCNHIKFSNDENNIALFCKKDKEIEINYKSLKNYYSEINKTNILILETLSHEVCHVYQVDLLIEKEIYKFLPHFYKNLLLEVACQGKNDIYYSIYKKKHDEFILEYHANICSILTVIDKLNKISVSEDILNNINKDYAHFIIETYNNTYPLATSDKIINAFPDAIDIKKIISPKLYKKYQIACNSKDIILDDEIMNLQYGYPIKDKTFYAIEDVAKGKIKTLNLIKDIQKI